MRLKIKIWFEDSTTKIEIPTAEDLRKVLPAFLKYENDTLKAQSLAKQLNHTLKKLNMLLD